MAEIRKQYELDNPREFNYYLAFNIDPAEKNPQKIEEGLKKQKSNWVSGSPIFRRYIALWRDMINVMVNDVEYDSLYNSYEKSGARARELAAAKKYKLEAAVSAIVLAHSTQVFKSILRDIHRGERYGWYSFEELETAVKDRGIRIVDNLTSPLDFMRFKDVDNYLRIVYKASLYDFLGKCPEADLKELSAATDNVYKSIDNRTSPEGVASGILVGLAKKVFADEKSKQQYDFFLASRERVWDEMKTIAESGCTLVSYKTRQRWENILEYVYGMLHDDAELYVNAALKYYGLFAG